MCFVIQQSREFSRKNVSSNLRRGAIKSNATILLYTLGKIITNNYFLTEADFLTIFLAFGALDVAISSTAFSTVGDNTSGVEVLGSSRLIILSNLAFKASSCVLFGTETGAWGLKSLLSCLGASLLPPFPIFSKQSLQ